MIIRIAKDDHEAFRQLFESFYGSLVAYANTLTHDSEQAKDLAQESFAQLWDKRKGLATILSVKAYMFSMVHNLYIDQYRKRRSRDKIFDELKVQALNDQFSSPEKDIAERERQLIQLVEQLPPKCRRILLMNKKEGKKYHEIADLLGISVKTVESQMRIAFKRIRKGFNNFHVYLLFLARIRVSVRG